MGLGADVPSASLSLKMLTRIGAVLHGTTCSLRICGAAELHHLQ
jgi:hypothetical protein